MDRSSAIKERMRWQQATACKRRLRWLILPRRYFSIRFGSVQPTQSASVTASFLSDQQIHDPTAPHMLPWLAAVGEDVEVVAPGLFEGVGQDRQAVKGPFLVDAV